MALVCFVMLNVYNCFVHDANKRVVTASTLRQDKKEGWGEFLWPDSKAYRGWWKAGKQHGFGIFRHPKGEERSGLSHETTMSTDRGFELSKYNLVLQIFG